MALRAIPNTMQLPPINALENNHVLDKPHVFLDEIMRQAQDSEIIRLSMHIREGKPISSFNAAGQEVKIVKKSEIVDGMFDWADQILCATNANRTSINNFVRSKKGYPEEPQIGDKIIGLTNHWDTVSLKENALTNGTIGYITSFDKDIMYLPYYIYDKPIDLLMTSMKTEFDDTFLDLPIDYNCLLTGQKTLTGQQEYKMLKDKRCFYEPPYDFAYGYAITVWKAQGSQWDKVLLYEEGHPYDKKEHIQYLYTGVTRAVTRLVLVTK